MTAPLPAGPEVGRRRNYYPAAEGREDAEILALSL